MHPETGTEQRIFCLLQVTVLDGGVPRRRSRLWQWRMQANTPVLIIFTILQSYHLLVIYFQRIKLCFWCLFPLKKFHLFVPELVILLIFSIWTDVTVVIVHRSCQKGNAVQPMSNTSVNSQEKSNKVRDFYCDFYISFFMWFHYIYIHSVLINRK